jgi:hypothetical protein
VEALDLAVGAGPVRLRREVTDAVAGEQLAQRAVLDVAEAVVGHQPPGDYAVLGEVRERALDKAGDGRCLLVVVELGIGEPRVVVDDRVRVVVADPGLGAHPLA